MKAFIRKCKKTAMPTVCLVLSASVLAIPDIQSAIERAEQLVGNQQFREAMEVITSARSGCNNDQRCLTLAAFTEGWVYERWAEIEAAPGSTPRALLEEAIIVYREALRLSPESRQIRDNLVLVMRRVGQLDEAATVVRRSIGDKAGARDYVVLGDLYREADKPQRAAAAYEQAIRREMNDPVAYSRLGHLVRRSDLDTAVLLENVTQLRARHPSIAADWYEAIIEREHNQNDRLSHEALVEWAGILADQQTLTYEALARLPSDWPSQPLKELRSIVNGDITAAQGWWREPDPVRRPDAAARVLRSVARTLSSDSIELSVKYLEQALDIAPGDRHYFTDLVERSNPRLDSALDLLTLYKRIENDGGLQRLSRDIAETLALQTEIMFSGKGEGYRRGDYEQVLRYHSVLGTVYFVMGQYESPTGWGPDSAHFQLDHALKTADFLHNDGAPYTPLPHLAEALGRVLYTRSKEVPVQEKEALVEQGDAVMLRATREYLDLDDLSSARTSVDFARSQGIEQRGAPEVMEVELILKTRETARTNLDAVFLQEGGRTVVRDDYSWLEPASTNTLRSDFIERQRFKVLADGSARALRVGEVKVAEELRDKAKSLEPLKKMSFGDEVRIQQLDEVILKNVPSSNFSQPQE